VHIAFISHDYPPLPHSGVGGATCTLAEGLVTAGQRATVFVVEPRPEKQPDRPEREESVQNGVRVIRLCLRSPNWMRWRPGMMWQRLRLLKTIRAEHRKTPFDILETADCWGWLPFGKIRGIPMLTRMQGTSFFYDHVRKVLSTDRLTHWFEKKSLCKSDHILAVSDFVAKEQLAVSLCPNAPTVLSYNACDTDFFCPAEKPDCEEGLIVFVNFVEQRKGIFPLAQAMNFLGPKYPKARIVFAGRVNMLPGGKPISDDIVGLVDPKYRDRLHFPGWQNKEQVRDWLRKANVCCYPSFLETFGIAAAEAMSVGKPVVYSKTGPGPELIDHGVSGLLIDPNDPKDIAEKISTVFENPQLAENMGKAAREKAVRLFSQREWVNQNLRFYQSLCPDCK
jgi:glycosyltransferase involved in cell wall biosynthesis